MTDFTDTALIVLGAGLATRFGSDKLATLLNDKPVAAHTLEACAGLSFAEKILVARGQDWTELFASENFTVLQNGQPEQGQSYSLRLALSHAKAPNALVVLADMPFVTTDHIRRVGQTFRRHGGKAVISTSSGYKGPPAMFARTTLEQQKLRGDAGARNLLHGAIHVPAPSEQLKDIDLLEDLVST